MSTTHRLAIFVCVAALAVPASAQVPPNDLCAGAIPVSGGINPNPPLGIPGSVYTNVGAATDASASCAIAGSTNDVWFSYTATVSGVAVIRTCTPPGFPFGTLTGSSLSVHSACGGTELACALSGLCEWGKAQLAVVVTAGTSYLIRVAGTGGATGTFYLTIIPPGPAPANDNCASAIPVFNGLNPAIGSFTTAGATPDGAASCVTPNPADRDVWFTYTATASGNAVINAAGVGPVSTNFPPILTCLASCGGPELVCSPTPGHTIVVPVTVGVTYVIRAGGSSIVGGNFVLNITPPANGPMNDECTGAIPLVTGANGPFTNALATTSPGAPANACFGSGSDLWYSFNPGPCSGTYIFDICPNVIYAAIDAFSACGGTPLGCSFFSRFTCGGPHLVLNASAFTQYFIRVTTPTGYPLAYPINVNAPALTFSAPVGPGSIQANLLGLPPNGLYFLAVTQNAGSFPFGALYGIDILINELLAELTNGYPFAGPVDGCGRVQIGPFSGLPSFITLYAVAFGFVGTISLTPAAFTPPAAFTIP